MAGPTAVFSNTILNHIFNAGTLTLPANLHLGLFTVAPVNDATPWTEVASGTGYSRLSLVRSTASFPGSTGREINLTSSVSFLEAAAGWGTIVAVGFFDAATVGNLLWWGPLTVNQQINAGDTFKIPAGAAGIRATL